MNSDSLSANGLQTRKRRHVDAASSPNKTTTATDKDVTSTKQVALDTWLSNAFYDLVIQDQDDVAEMTYNRAWSRKVKELEDGTTKFNFKTFHEFVWDLRSSISNRQLKSQSALARPDDKEGLTGQVSHRATFTGIQEGKQVTTTVVAIVQVNLEKGERKVRTESFIVQSSLQPVPEAESLAFQAWIKNAVVVMFMQGENSIFEVGFDTFFSRKVSVTANGKTSDFEEYKKLVKRDRENSTNRFIVSEDIVVATVSDKGKAGEVAHFYTVQGVKNGKAMQGDCVIALSVVVENGKSKLVLVTALEVMRDV